MALPVETASLNDSFSTKATYPGSDRNGQAQSSLALAKSDGYHFELNATSRTPMTVQMRFIAVSGIFTKSPNDLRLILTWSHTQPDGRYNFLQRHLFRIGFSKWRGMKLPAVCARKSESEEMSDESEDLATYLRDHFAGGIGALELLDRLIKVQEKTDLEGFFEKLRADVHSDHEQLHHLMSALDVEESSIRDAAAWIAEKFSRPKLTFGAHTKNLVLLQALETLFMGVSGKCMLWRGLAGIQPESTVLQRFDFQQLEARATQQLERIEAKRMEVARETLRC